MKPIFETQMLTAKFSLEAYSRIAGAYVGSTSCRRCLYTVSQVK